MAWQQDKEKCRHNVRKNCMKEFHRGKCESFVTWQWPEDCTPSWKNTRGTDGHRAQDSMETCPCRVLRQHKTSTAEKWELLSLDFLFLVKFEVLLSRTTGGEKSKAQLCNDRAPAALDKIKHQYRNHPYKLVNEISNLGLRHTKLFPNFLLKEIFSSSGMSKWSYLPPSQTNLSQHFQPCLAQRLDRPGNFLQQVPSWRGPIAPGEIYGKPFLIGITDWHWLVLLQR